MATAKKSAFFYYGISAGHEQRKLIFSQYVDFLHLVHDVFNHEEGYLTSISTAQRQPLTA